MFLQDFEILFRFMSVKRKTNQSTESISQALNSTQSATKLVFKLPPERLPTEVNEWYPPGVTD